MAVDMLEGRFKYLCTRYALAAVWIVLIFIALTTRPLLVIDETRYASVAWEMWLNHDWLVPHLNGEPYSHKPPLLFWLINISWSLFGVSDVAMRIVPPLFGLGSLYLTGRIAWHLWPGDTRACSLSPLLLFTSLLWLIYSPALMFDLLMSFFVLLGVLGLCRVWSGGGFWNFYIVSVAIAGGILTKGPIVLLYLIPTAVLAPLWMERANWVKIRQRWYAGIVLSIALGSCIALVWALPAAWSGGVEYRDAILWHQSAGRMVNAFAHAKPVWWYLAILPLALFPWSLWTTGWRCIRKHHWDEGSRFCASWLISGLLLLSLLSGKQPHYLLPLLPAAALLMARACNENQHSDRMSRLPLLIVILLGSITVVLIIAIAKKKMPDWVMLLSPGWAVAVVFLGILTVAIKVKSIYQEIVVLATTSLIITTMLQFGMLHQAWTYYDSAPFANRVTQLENNQIPIAIVGKYHGQFQFAGRLRKPLTEISLEQIDSWATENPLGRVIMIGKNLHCNQYGKAAEYFQPYRAGYVAIVPAAVVLDKNSVPQVDSSTAATRNEKFVICAER